VDPLVVKAIAEVVGPTVGFLAFGGILLICFPSTRGAIADWIRQRPLRHADAVDVMGQLAALRSEVQALRQEVDLTNRSLAAAAARVPELTDGARGAVRY
jgi:hypothetical protein